MVKVKAKINVNYNGNWKKPGDVFEINESDHSILKYVDVIEIPKREPEREPIVQTVYESVNEPIQDIPEVYEAPRRRGRPKRTDTE